MAGVAPTLLMVGPQPLHRSGGPRGPSGQLSVDHRLAAVLSHHPDCRHRQAELRSRPAADPAGPQHGRNPGTAFTSGMTDLGGRPYRSPLTFQAGPIPIHFASIADFAGLLAIVLIIFVRFLRIHRDQERASSELAAARNVQELMIPQEKLQDAGLRSGFGLQSRHRSRRRLLPPRCHFRRWLARRHRRRCRKRTQSRHERIHGHGRPAQQSPSEARPRFWNLSTASWRAVKASPPARQPGSAAMANS